MELAHTVHELALGVAHVEQRLSRLGVAEEHDEVHRMALVQRHPTCESSLKPPIPGPCPPRGSMITYGRRLSSTVTPLGGTMRSSA